MDTFDKGSGPTHGRPFQVALLGNPNTGKTTLFNALSGLRHRTGNYPGVTVEVRKGALKASFNGTDHDIDLLDLPGTYSLAARSPDELLAVDVVTGCFGESSRPDALVCMADASNLERSLYLFSQAVELGVPVVLALSMVDLAAKQGIKVDTRKLSEQLGLAVIAVNATKGTGLRELKAAIIEAALGKVAPNAQMLPEAVKSAQAELAKAWNCHPGFVLRALVDEGGEAEKRLTAQKGATAVAELQAARQKLTTQHQIALPVLEPRCRYPWIRKQVAGTVERSQNNQKGFTEKADRWLVHPFWGTGIFLLIMLFFFQAIFVLAKPVMEWLGELTDGLASWLGGQLGPGPFNSLVCEGVIPGVGAVLVFLPQILILFAFMGVLEDCGYMARAAFLMDRLMARCGLSGKAFIPLLSSLGCAVPGILSTRVIENRRDRLAAIVVAPLMSCSARLPVYVLLTGAFLSQTWWLPGLTLFGLYMIGFVVAPLVAWTLKSTLLAGEKPIFMLEMPPFRVPAVKVVVRRMVEAAWEFLARAGTLILASMVVVWALLHYPSTTPDGKYWPEVIEEAKGEDRLVLLEQWKSNTILARVSRSLDPLWAPVGWDWRIGAAALASFPAREVVVASLGIVFGQDPEWEETAVGDESEKRLASRLQEAKRADGSRLFTIPTALSLLVFVALCCQCVSTLAVMARETRSWKWPAFTFAYMTTLAYLGAILVFQVGTMLEGWIRP